MALRTAANATKKSLKLYSRQSLEPSSVVNSRLNPKFQNPDYSRTGRKYYKRNLRGPALGRYYIPEINDILAPSGHIYKSPETIHREFKNAQARKKGKPPTQKGQGKKSKRRT